MMHGSDPFGGGVALASMAALLGDRTRAAFCVALLDRRAWTATELAREAGVAVSTASEHLNLLVAGGLLTEVRQGRHRYVRLAGADIASLIESMISVVADHRPPDVRSLAVANRRRTLAYARTCYDHLAGALGVELAEAMTRHGLLQWEGGLALTNDGATWLADLGIRTTAGGARQRPLVRSCLDFTERRPHLAGAVGAAICQHALTSGWVTRIGKTRAVSLTDVGRDALARHLGIGKQILDPV